MDVFCTITETRWTAVNIDKCILADGVSGFFFVVCLLVVCETTWNIPPLNVLDRYVRKCAQAQSYLCESWPVGETAWESNHA